MRAWSLRVDWRALVLGLRAFLPSWAWSEHMRGGITIPGGDPFRLHGLEAKEDRRRVSASSVLSFRFWFFVSSFRFQLEAIAAIQIKPIRNNAIIPGAPPLRCAAAGVYCTSPKTVTTRTPSRVQPAR